MKENEVHRTEDVHGMIDLFERAHAGREHDRAACVAHASKKFVVGQRGRGDLVAGWTELIHEVHRPFVPAGREPSYAEFGAVTGDLRVLEQTELEAALQVAVGRSERILAWPRQFLRGVDDFDRPLLELDGVAACPDCRVDQLLGDIERPVVVDAYFGNDVALLAIANGGVSNSDLCHSSPFGLESACQNPA